LHLIHRLALAARRAVVLSLAMLFAPILALAAPLNYQDLWWAGTAENGWGMSITQQGNALFTVLYVYDAAGRPQWVVMPAAEWNAASTTINGALYIPTGSSYAAYDPGRFAAGASVGTASVEFTGTNAAILRYTINGRSGTKSMSRQAFGTGAAIGNYTDIWWGGASQNGWGISITQKGATFFAVWYTYDAQGRASWLVMPNGGYTSADTVSGTLYRTSGSPWLGTAYDPSRLAATPVGNLSFTFDATGARMRYSVDGVEGSIGIARQVFGTPAPVATSSFAKLQQSVLTPLCGSCHTAGHPYALESGLVLDPAVSYRNLVDGAVKLGEARARGYLKQVAARDPDHSFLYRKLLLWDPSQAAPLGSAMPLGYTSPSVGQLEFVRRWIEAGAPETGEVADAKLLEDTTLPAYAPFAPLVAPPAGKGFQLHVDPFQVQPDFERELFVYRGLGNAEAVYVNRIETRMRVNSHHLVLYGFQDSTPATVMPPRDVVRDIRNPDGSLNFLNMFPMAYHVFVAGAMSTTGGYAFPAGVALRLPGNAALDFNVHYVNHGTAPITGEAYANLHTVPASEVQQVASTLNLSNSNLNLPPLQRTTQTRTFNFAATTRILALTSHMHKLGERFVIKLSGGPRDGETVYESSDWEHPEIVTFDTPLVLQAGQGLTSVITYNNTTNRTINFGLTSEDEMGIIFGYTY
jgi:hypothetical protein